MQTQYISCFAEAMVRQVQELLKDHPDLVASLNARFKVWTQEAGGLRQALLTCDFRPQAQASV